ncbi:MAG: family N-acetyltransferase [Ferruginibacter sp.]|nr:family N-acetyltransferase [Ferruginibacter sp.]
MLHLSFDPFPGLVTERLILRRLSPGDAQEIFLIRSDESVNEFIDRSPATTLEDAMNFIEKIDSGINASQSMYWAIQLKTDPTLVGTICLWNIEKEKQQAEIGFELRPAFQGKGIMQEAVEMVIQFGFDTMQLQMIIAFPQFNNKRSLRLLAKNDFSRNLQLEQEMSPGLDPYVIYTLSNPNT